jgi:hypothetical protein
MFSQPIQSVLIEARVEELRRVGRTSNVKRAFRGAFDTGRSSSTVWSQRR